MTKNWRDAFPSTWFSYKDLEHGPMLVTIKHVTDEKVGDDTKPVVWFNEHEKGLGLNITNGNSIEQIAGTSDPDKWPGTTLVLFRTETDFQGKRVPCVRVRAPKPGAKIPEPEPDYTDDSVPF